MNKAEAAEFLGISERMVGRHTTSGRLTVRYVKGKTRDVADYDPEEVSRLKVELDASKTGTGTQLEENALVLGSEFPISTQHSRNLEKRNRDTVRVPDSVPDFESFARAVAEGVALVLESRGEVRLAEKLTLTIKEAVTYSGRPEKSIRDALAEGRLEKVKMPRGAVGLKRWQLEEWCK